MSRAESPPGARIGAVVIGGSAGGIAALQRILPRLPPGFCAPVIVVIHLPAERESLLASLFHSRNGLPAKEAEDKEPLLAGTIYFAPPDYHLLVERDGRLSLSAEEPVLYSRPSIDVLFETAADAFGRRVIGVVLSGASSDGARGLAAIGRAGGGALVQAPDEAEISTMPLAALTAWPAAAALPCAEIVRRVISLCHPDAL